MARIPARGLAALVLAFSAIPAVAQVAAPPKPESYNVVIRYRIEADRDGRVLQFREMLASLKAAGFVQADKEDAHLDALDPSADRLEGTVKGSTATQLLTDPRVLSILLNPAKAPAAAAVTQISATLPGGLFVEQQQRLHTQTVSQLEKLGFRENTGYDHQGFTRVRGAIPSNVVSSLIKDLRSLPSGWFAPAASRSEMPLPFRNVNPLRIVEVLPTAPDAEAAVVVDQGKGKLAADIAKIASDPAMKDQAARVEILLNNVPAGGVRELIDRINLVAPSAKMEGFTGQAAIVRLNKSQEATDLGRLPEVRHVRLPRAISETGYAGSLPTASDPLISTGIKKLHDRGFTGAGVKVVVIATGFPGIAMNSSNVLDLTAELSPTVEPLPMDPRHPGTGTAAAMAVRAAAPSADLILVRIDPYSFHQLITIARAATGYPDSEAMQTRLLELTRESAQLGERRKVVMEEYSTAMNNISDDDKPTKRREAAKKSYESLKADETKFTAKFDRFKAIRAGLYNLASAAVIVNTVVSEVGQPHDGLSALNAVIGNQFAAKPQRSAIRPNREPPPPVWVQAAGNAAQSVWSGPFTDTDGNGVMEFAAGAPKGLWTSELNFLALYGADGKGNSTLGANSTIRITAQWREPIDPDSGMESSQHPLTLKLLRQFDATGKTAASDELIEVARASSTPVRIFTTASAAVFEQTLEVKLPTDGRYALRVEGRNSASLRPSQMPSSEITPRIVVEAGDAATAAKGLIGFESITAKQVGVGIPGESTLVTTVGTPISQKGAGPGITLLPKPDVTAPASGPDGKTIGSTVSAGYVGGAMACLASSGMRPKNLPQTLGIPPGSELQFTDMFLQYLPQR